MNTSDLDGLPVSEKLKLVTKLWDDIAASGEDLVVRPEILAEASRWSEEIKADH
jgi:putative addiction module component (TIGR02574 family)